MHEQHYSQSSSFQATILCQKDIYVRPDQLLCLVLLFRPRLDIIDIYAGIFSTKLKMRAQDSYFPVFQSPEDMPNLQGRTAIVTGGACGIGGEIARALAIHKCRVIMVNARAKQGTEAVSQIRKEVGQDAAIEWRYCDMTDLIQVQEVFSSLCDELPRLDLCILGSGIDQAHFTTDLHCIDAYFGMMWLGHFYASNLLWPLLRRTSRITGAPAPRVIFEAPGQQRSKSVADDSSSDEEDIRRTAYDAEVCSEIFRRSRTSMILGVRHGLAERIAKRHHDNIYAIAVQPSKALSDASSHPRRDSHWQPSDLCDHVLDTLSKDDHFTVRSSSRIVLYAATSSDVENEYLNGAYLVDVGVSGREKDLAADPSLGPGFWDISERAIKAVVGKDAMVPWDQEWVRSPKDDVSA
ncbi:NAD(P)-binding protein [Aureobasidium pullulans]|uniref:NAD(P)-binding protein n=1 Tax=Aureobasidium pullulans TaxID=5580 RepID=A0A4S9SG34_AURPU|nr:NAD(P)-binding protein [Aureobasidium pullulans]